jgi:hypothetical protein
MTHAGSTSSYWLVLLLAIPAEQVLRRMCCARHIDTVIRLYNMCGAIAVLASRTVAAARLGPVEVAPAAEACAVAQGPVPAMRVVCISVRVTAPVGQLCIGLSLCIWPEHVLLRLITARHSTKTQHQDTAPRHSTKTQHQDTAPRHSTNMVLVLRPVPHHTVSSIAASCNTCVD